MISIKVDVRGLDALQAHLAGHGKQVRFAAAKALTQTASRIKAAMPEALDRALDRPTPFTKRGVFLKAARPAELTAIVGFMDRQASYLKYQIGGGVRRPGPRGIKLPGNIVLNAYGNIPRGVIDKLIEAAEGPGYTETQARRLGVYGDRRKKAAPIELFYGKPRGRGWENAPVGVYRRVPGQPGKLIPIVLFPRQSMTYKPVLNIRRVAETIVQRDFDTLFAAALRDALATAR